ncbi:MAG: 2-oxoacid:acceptor oxidoreductase family protein [Planctomycetales bacterium]
MAPPLGLPLTTLIAGLGGQGVIVAGDILIDAAMRAGFNVKKSEIHGLSRRFGSVSCQVRIGEELHSPIRGHGGVDVLLSLEGYEAIKNLPFLKPEGIALVNRLWHKPGASSPAEQSEPVGADDPRIGWFPGTELTHQAECARSLNFFMLGVLAPRLPMSLDVWNETLDTSRSRGSADADREMFSAGYRHGSHADSH